MARIVIVAVVLLTLAGAADARHLRLARDPVPLQGIPLRPPTGLRLAVSAKRPFVLDVDAETTRQLPSLRNGYVVGVGGRAAVLITSPSSRRGRVYAIRDNGTATTQLGLGADAAPAGDGESVWIKREVSRSRCTLRHVRLDGRVLRAPRAVPCSWALYPAGLLGLRVRPSRIVDPSTGRTVFKTSLGIVAVAGRTIVLHGHDEFVLFDTATGARKRRAWPDTSGRLYITAVEVRGRYVALSFGNPSWTSEGRYPDDQYYDAWVLDTDTAELTQLPAMPAFVALKWTGTAWTRDGRLVLLTRSGGNDVVAVWRPGQERLGINRMRLRARDSVAYTGFALLG